MRRDGEVDAELTGVIRVGVRMNDDLAGTV